MENKINIAELLKDCPKGMELDCTIWENVTFEEVVTVKGFDDKKRVKIILSTHYSDGTKDEIILTEFGTYTDDETAKCVIFHKGETSWDRFREPFKDGDIVATEIGSIFIYNKSLNSQDYFGCYVGLSCMSRRSEIIIADEFTSKTSNLHLATEEEQKKLFDAIKANGYKWNSETKTLEKLVESKEDTDDKVVMSGIYFDREYYADEVELHLNNYEIEIRDGKTYAIFKTKTLKPEFKSGDVIVASGAIVLFKQVHSLYEEPHVDFYCGFISKHKTFILKTINFQHCGKISSSRYATEKEKAELFNAIKANGYCWNSETKTLEKLPKFKVGDKIKDTRNNSEGIILKVTDKGFECRFEFGNFLLTFSEQDYFNLVQNKSDITLNQFYMEEINLDWCKQHGMTLSQVNVARDTSYYLETDGYIILVYTISTTGDQKLHVINPTTKKEIEFSLSRLNRDLNKLNSITTDDLRKLCELVNLDYPFKS